jgi:hypothetical protein
VVDGVAGDVVVVDEVDEVDVALIDVVVEPEKTRWSNFCCFWGS